MKRYDGHKLYPDVPDCTHVQDDERTWFYRVGLFDCFVTMYRDGWDWSIHQGYGQGKMIIAGHNVTEGDGYRTAEDAKMALVNYFRRRDAS